MSVLTRWQARVLAACVFVFAAAGATRAQDAQTGPQSQPQAQSQGQNQTTIDDLKKLVLEQNKRLADLEKKEDDKQKVNKDEIKKIFEEMKGNAANQSATPTWMQNLTFFGDFRLRYENDHYNWGTKDLHDNRDRNRARFRLRFGLIKTWLDKQLEVGFRLASGQTDDPTTANQTFGDSTTTGAGDGVSFAKRPVWIDLAYAKFAPNCVPGLSITGGKMKNPFVNTNELFTSTDVNPEGFWVNYTTADLKDKATGKPLLGPVDVFGGMGYFILREGSGHDDTDEFGYQFGARVNFTPDVHWTSAGYFQNIRYYSKEQGIDYARGNDPKFANIPDFGIVGMTNFLEFPVCKVPVKPFFDFAHNCHEADATNTAALNNYHDANNAYAAGIKIGQNKKKGDWAFIYEYAHIEANSVPGELVDTSFGFANREGHVFGPRYNILDDLTVGATVYITEPIFSPASANSTSTTPGSKFEDKTIITQIDLIWNF
jgi:hypothetical protein